MANSVTIKQEIDSQYDIKVSIFDEQGNPVLSGWQNFSLNLNKVWNPSLTDEDITQFYIANAYISNDADQLISNAVFIEFNTLVQDASVLIGIKKVIDQETKNIAYYFTATSLGVEVKIINEDKTINNILTYK